jgi:hypothetical protein
MANSKKIFITTESREIFIVRMNRKSKILGFCPNRAADVELVTLDEAVSISSRKTLEILSRIQTGAVHSIETLSGHLLVCLSSLVEEKELINKSEKKL